MSRSDAKAAASLALRMLDLIAAGSVIVSLLALGALFWWFFDLFSHFRLQYFAVQLVALVVSIAARRWFWVPVLGITMLINAVPLVPYLPTAQASPLVQPMTLLQANVSAWNADPSLLAETIERRAPDLLLLIEYTPRLAEELARFESIYRYRIEQPAEDAFGLALWSRFPYSEEEVDLTGPTAAVRATVNSPSGVFEIYGVHLMPPMTQAWSASRNDALRAIAARPRREHALVCGDLNISPYSPIFARFMEQSGLDHVGRHRGFTISWPAFLPIMGIPIDHCLTGPGVLIGNVERLGDIGSDHYPMLIEFDLEREP